MPALGKTMVRNCSWLPASFWTLTTTTLAATLTTTRLGGNRFDYAFFIPSISSSSRFPLANRGRRSLAIAGPFSRALTMSSDRSSREKEENVLKSSMRMTPTTTTKEIWIIRHGQATHNPRAEAARQAGCSLEEFLELMKQDDSLDSELTELGQQQADAVFARHASLWTDIFVESSETAAATSSSAWLVVSSPLSRALETADRAVPAAVFPSATRLCLEHWREINGWLLNAKRRSKAELQRRFPHWNFDHLQTTTTRNSMIIVPNTDTTTDFSRPGPRTNPYLDVDDDEDPLWNPDALESRESCQKRGVQALKHLLWERHERRMIVVAHGGLLRFLLETVTLQDGRQPPPSRTPAAVDDADSTAADEPETSTRRSCLARFENGEVRRYLMHWHAQILASTSLPNEAEGDDVESEPAGHIVLTEIDTHQPVDLP